MLITQELLEASGYRRYPSGHDKWCLGLWQKTIRSRNGLKFYFINFYLWQFPDRDVSASVEVALYREDGLSHEEETDFRVALQIGSKTSLAQVENFYAELYEKLGCVPDIHNHDGVPLEPRDRFARLS